MTARQLWEATLIELNKVQAPSLLLEDYNYFINKAIYQFINKQYNIYDVNQQTTDNLRVLKGTAKLNIDLNKVNEKENLYKNDYQFDLPKDYLHMLNCICEYKVVKPFKCYNADQFVHFKASRLTADLYGEIINNYYMRPTYKRPYYYINNINNIIGEKPNTNVGRIDGVELPTNPINTNRGTDINSVNITEQKDQFNNKYAKDIPNNGLLRNITINGISINGIDKLPKVRYGNPSNVRIEIKCGDNPSFQLNSIYVDYIKTPQNIRLTQDQIDLVEDTSQILEFPDYVCQEIINELVHIVMENASDPRLQTHIPVSQSIASPAQQQALKK